MHSCGTACVPPAHSTAHREMCVDTPLSVRRPDGSYIRSPMFPLFPAGTPPDYARLVSRCLSPTPAARPTADEVSAELVTMLMQRDIKVPAQPPGSSVSSSNPASNSCSSTEHSGVKPNHAAGAVQQPPTHALRTAGAGPAAGPDKPAGGAAAASIQGRGQGSLSVVTL